MNYKNTILKPKVLFEKLSFRLVKFIFKQKLKHTKQISLEQNAEIVLCMLCGHKSFYEAVASIKIFQYFINLKFSCHIHDDGTLSNNDIQFIKSHLINVKIIRKAEANSLVNKFLEENKLLQCLELRKIFIFSIRLFDFVFFAPNKKVI
ncbi:MAG: hypothetical protein NTY07_16245 [Bacteroidia bacterium]|nr:hypothetical protein [Bacteroidia bacterium]